MQHSIQVNAEGGAVAGKPTDYGFLLKQLSLDIPNRGGESGLKKYDSFTRWMSKELGEVDSHVKTGFSVNWETLVNEGVIKESGMSHNEDTYILEPSISQDQLYSILDFTPSWSFVSIKTTVRFYFLGT